MIQMKHTKFICLSAIFIFIEFKVIAEHTSRFMEREVDIKVVEDLLRKFAIEKLIR